MSTNPPSQRPVVQGIKVETAPDGQTSNFDFQTTKGEISLTFQNGSFSLFLELMLKHSGDIAAKSPPYQAGQLKELLANPIPITGLGISPSDDENKSHLIIMMGAIRLTFLIGHDALVPLCSAFIEKHTPKDLLKNISGLHGQDSPLGEQSSQPASAIPTGVYSLRPSRHMPIIHKIRTGGPTLTYPDLGVCAYCGTTIYRPGTDLPLTDEHILADGFGGTLVLPKASCEDHQKKTTTIEGSILRTIFLAPRAHLGIRARKKKRNPIDKFPLRATVDGREITIEVALEEYPTMLYLMNLGPPGLLVGRPKQIAGIQGVWLKAFNLTFDKIQKSVGATSMMSPVTDTKRFCQFLAKTAQTLAVAELGADGFKPLLRKLIEGHIGIDEMHQLVGGQPEPNAATDSLHEIGLEQKRGANGKIYVVAKLRFFANLGAPIYYVVVGEMTARAA
jgi:hypothetical protein